MGKYGKYDGEHPLSRLITRTHLYQSFQIIGNWRDPHDRVETAVLTDQYPTIPCQNLLTSEGLIAAPGNSKAIEEENMDTSSILEDNLLTQSRDDELPSF